MKKLISITSSILFFLSVLIGCDNTDVPHQSSNGEEIHTTSQLGEDNSTSAELINDDSYTFNIALQAGTYEGDSIIQDTNIVDFGSEVFEDATVSRELNITIADNNYELEYLESAFLPLNAYKVHTYRIKGSDNSKIIISAETGKIIEYVNIPIDVSLPTEKEYLQFMQKLIGQNCDITDYVYKCTTWHYAFYENGMESTVEDGFHICTNNETWVAYSFYFDKYINGIKTLEHMSAEFYQNSFSLEIYDFNYQGDDFAQITTSMNTFEAEFNNYLKSNKQEKYTIANVDISSNILFIRNGVPYIQTRANVDYSVGEGTEYYTTVVQTITNLTRGDYQSSE